MWAAPRVSIRRSLAVVFAVAISFVSAVAQPVTRLTAPPSCARCTVALEKLATIGGADLDVTVRAVDVAARTSTGQFVVGHIEDQYLSLFDQRGRFVRRIGRQGGGPGEYRAINAVEVGVGDSVHVFDNANARRTMLGPDLQLVRESPLPSRLARDQAIFLDDGRMLLNMRVRSGPNVGLPLSLVSQSGAVIRAFGATPPLKILRATSNADLRTIGRSADGTVWSAHHSDYVVERWDLSGRLVSTFVREAAFLVPPTSPVVDGQVLAAPPIALRGIWEDSERRLWVFTLIADRNWRAGLVPIVQDGRTAGYRPGDPEKIYDTVIEVIDLRTSRVLVSQRINAYVSRVMPDGTVLTGRHDADGFEYLEFFRPTFVEPKR
jgi:hypothetical protein